MEIKRGDMFLVDLNPAIIIPFTTRIKEPLLPCHVKVVASIGGLTKDSVLLCEQIRVVDRKRLVRKLGNIGEEGLQKVAAALKVILGLE